MENKMHYPEVLRIYPDHVLPSCEVSCATQQHCIIQPKVTSSNSTHYYWTRFQPNSGKIRSSHPKEQPCQSAISIKLLRNFIEITLRHGCSAVNLLHIFRTPLSKWLLLNYWFSFLLTLLTYPPLFEFMSLFLHINALQKKLLYD